MIRNHRTGTHDWARGCWAKRKRAKYLTVAVVCLGLSACTGGISAAFPATAHTSGKGSLAPEHQKLWSRPTEVGYTLGNQIRGEAWHVSILWGLISVGNEEPPVLPIIGDVLLVNKLLTEGSPLTRSAAADAVLGEEGADGIYILAEKANGFSFLGLITFKGITVYGRALTLVDHGEVAPERADRERYLRALGGAAEVQLTPEEAGGVLPLPIPAP